MIDPARQSREMEFRDGKRQVPDYLAILMSGIETIRMTYEEAIQAGNKQAEETFLNAQQDKILAAHFREQR
jgi:hypothetical protein